MHPGQTNADAIHKAAAKINVACAFDLMKNSQTHATPCDDRLFQMFSIVQTI
jgi:hypothetical protein